MEISVEISDEQKQYLQANVDNLVFVDEKEADKFKCLNCKKVAIQLTVANCSHIFCSNCLTKIFDRTCPGCGKAKVTEVRTNDKYQREILNLKVQCRNWENGCTKILALRRYEQHHTTRCQFFSERLAKKVVLGQKELETSKEPNRSRAVKPKIKDKVLKEVANLKVQPNDDCEESDGHAYNYIWRVTNFKKMIEGLKVYNEFSKNYGNSEIGTFWAQLCLSEDYAHLCITLKWSNLSKCTCMHARKFTLFDQSDFAEKKHIIMRDTPIANIEMKKSSFLFHKLIPISLLMKECDLYARDDSMLIMISIIPLAEMYKSVVSYDGTLKWCMQNYSAKKQEEVIGRRKFCQSPSFYTASKGYRVYAILYLDGYNTSKGKFISIYVGFIIGEFDKLLLFPFNAMVKIFLLDQTESAVKKQHVCREIVVPYHEYNRLNGRHDFILQSEVEDAKYLKNDTLLFKFEVEII